MLCRGCGNEMNAIESIHWRCTGVKTKMKNHSIFIIFMRRTILNHLILGHDHDTNLNHIQGAFCSLYNNDEKRNRYRT